MSLKERIILFAGVVVLLAVTVFASVYRQLRAFAVEDSIHDTFYPVAKALYGFEHDHGSPSTNLTQLVPKYLTQIPSSRFADSVQYSVMDDGKASQLDIHSRSLSEARLYCCRSTQQFTAREEQRVLGRYHAVWTVLRDP